MLGFSCLSHDYRCNAILVTVETGLLRAIFVSPVGHRMLVKIQGKERYKGGERGTEGRKGEKRKNGKD